MEGPQQQSTQAYDGPVPSSSSSSSRATLGFPLGTALLLIVIFCLSGVLSCFYHWEKIQSLRRRGRRAREDGDDEENAADGEGAVHGMPPPPSKPGPTDQYAKQDRSESLPVIMPGDRVPKFIARPFPWDLPASFAAPPRASDLPSHQLHKLATAEGPPSPTPAPPDPPATVSCATPNTSAPAAAEPALPLTSDTV